jgi:hypothetical protein
MELRQFISKALSDIIGAVQDVDKAAPGTVVTSGVSTTAEFVQLGVTHLQSVDFEVTVRADEQSGSEAKLSVVAAVIGGAVKGESGKSGGHSATLRFKVPIRLSAIERA